MFTDGLLIIVGWATGMLVNYLADVLPLRRRFAAPLCTFCQADIPPVNYWLWPRRCPACGKRRSWRVWLVEALFAALAVWLWHTPPATIGFWGGWLLLAYFGVVVVIDMEYHLILHPVSLVGAVIALALGWMLNGLPNTLIGGVVGFGAMWLLYMLGELVLRLAARLRGQTVDDVALGFGDVNLSGVLGLLLGWPGILVGLVLAIFIGGAVSLVYIVGMVVTRRYKMFMALPYGPFLVAGAVMIIYFRDAVIGYLQGY